MFFFSFTIEAELTGSQPFFCVFFNTVVAGLAHISVNPSVSQSFGLQTVTVNFLNVVANNALYTHNSHLNTDYLSDYHNIFDGYKCNFIRFHV